MAPQWRRRWANSIGRALLIALAIGTSLSTGSAQQIDPNILLRQFNALYSAGNYTAAIGVGEKLEALVRTRLGTDNANYAVVLNNLGLAYRAQGRFDDAISVYTRAVAIRQKILGQAHPDVAHTLNNLANAYDAQGKFAQAEEIHKRVLAIWQQLEGGNSTNVGTTLNNLAVVYRSEGKFVDAEGLFKRALAIRETNLGSNHPDVAQTLNNLALVYDAQGRYAEAASLIQRALSIRQQALGPNHPLVATSLYSLAIVYEPQGKLTEAEGLLSRALAIRQNALGPEHPDVAQALNSLAIVYKDEGKFAEAEQSYRRALAMEQKWLGADHPDVAGTLNNLAILYDAQGKWADAAGLYKRALTILESTQGADHPAVATTLNNLGVAYREQGNITEAEAELKRALAIREKILGANHPSVAQTLNNLAISAALRDDAASALTYSRKATAVLIGHAAIDAAATSPREDPGGIIEHRADIFQRHVASLWSASRARLEPQSSLGSEAFEIAQWASHSSAARALQQLGVRTAAGSDALGTLVRNLQDHTAERRFTDAALITALSRPEAQQDRNTIDSLNKKMSGLDNAIVADTAQLAKQFPSYAALASPKPLTVTEVQSLLRSDEALVFFLIGKVESYVFALTRERFGWARIPLSADAVVTKVAQFRRGLDVDELTRTTGQSETPRLFDLGFAYDLYRTLLAPVRTIVEDKKQLVIVPTGATTALPFNLLVTAPSSGPTPTLDNLIPYRDAAWLINEKAITVLPSIASLKTLRGFNRPEVATKPMVGFGDPLFNPNAFPAASASARTVTRTLIQTSYTNFWEGAAVDRDKLAQALPALPDTAVELRSVAQNLGAPPSDIHLGKDASETTVKRATLSDYRIVYFATHGLVAGDIKGLAEPSLALSIPQRPSGFDDGLLTASEVAQLKLDADWVVLSACNTIAGDTPGAEALSGLARAFFYAGARALLVSHWAVDSAAATRLTTSTFDVLTHDPKLGRAEALRQAMLMYLNDRMDIKNAYPAFWGPFEVVGDSVVK